MRVCNESNPFSKGQLTCFPLSTSIIKKQWCRSYALSKKLDTRLRICGRILFYSVPMKSSDDLFGIHLI
ncbi:Hypothetical predicted protein [Octopus vulgaris]|uniref:Uncharacterized protein n=1 Tax=Octopus vulgaris TaxID=6645 RepID=A0AA36BJ12_OCTVU|nr:Hypothetical predicted protein [Octopus vulgaris]